MLLSFALPNIDHLALTTRDQSSQKYLKHIAVNIPVTKKCKRTKPFARTNQPTLMASAVNANPYTYQRPSTMATRSLVSDSPSTEAISGSSKDVDTQQKPSLQRKTTNHYEQAAASATKAGELPATTAGSAAANVTDRPGAQRQQSWKRSDLKGHQQGQMLANLPSTHGYSTTQK